MKEKQLIDLQHIEQFIKEVTKRGFAGHKVDEFQIKVELIEYSQMASKSDIRLTYVLEKKVMWKEDE